MLRNITFICLVMLGLNAKAQFTIAEDTLHIYGYAKANSSDFVDLEVHSKIKSIGLGDEVIKWTRLTNDLPDNDWGTAVCDLISCKTPTTDTGSWLFMAKDSGNLIFHCYPSMVGGDGKMVVRFSRQSNPMEYVDVVVFMEVWKPVSILPVVNSITNVYPNPARSTMVVVNDQMESGSLEVFNSTGQSVLKADYYTGMALDLETLSAGIYTLVVSDGNNRSVRQFAKN